MIIGIDFDNTIVCYDAIFHRIAVERGLVPPTMPTNKTAIRDHLRAGDRDAVFTELQGIVYGPRLVDAEMFPGVKAFLRACQARGHGVRIISHKTRFPYAGERHDLHGAAREWLRHHGFFAADGAGLPAEAAFFELTKQDKLARIATEKCDVFIDDLPELLAEPAFPAGVRRVLFDPADVFSEDALRERVRSWTDIHRLLLGEEAANGESDVAEAAEALFERSGLRLASPPIRLAGGGNNRVFEARDDRGGRFLLKHYFFQPGDSRDRFESERQFYRLAAVAAPGQTPRAIGWAPASRLGLFEFIEGRKLAPGEVGGAEMDAALQFFAALNQARGCAEARALPAAAEACFSVEKHVCTVERRMARLQDIAGETDVDVAARAFVQGELAPVWAKVRARLIEDGEAARPLGETERCVSPSDFGFHNAVRAAGGALVFLDFEYAGWDDPAKVVCDFFCQPAIPATAAGFDRFTAGVGQAAGWADGRRFALRCRALLPLYRVKWCGIMLNEFVRLHRGRRAFALGAGGLEERKRTQLAAARGALAAARDVFHGTAA